MIEEHRLLAVELSIETLTRLAEDYSTEIYELSKKVTELTELNESMEERVRWLEAVVMDKDY